MKKQESPKEIKSRVHQRLIWISEKNGGSITSHEVIEDARNPKSPLHSQFQWDLKKAAYAHWVERANELIREVRFDIITKTMKVEAIGFLRDPSLPHDEAGYRSVQSIRTSKVASREVLRMECLRAASALRRAREVAVALDLSNEVEAILAQVMNMIKAA